MLADNGELLVDPAVSRAKFRRELDLYRQLEDQYLRRGWWMLKAEFPEVLVLFGTPNLKPPAVVFGALLDFTNYDLHPPSVRLVDPFTRVAYRGRELPTWLKRRVPAQLPPGLPPELIAGTPEAEQPLMVFHSPDDIPFLCIPGTREYHDHPAHTGDSWLLHRGKGEGTLHHILDVLYKYGVEPINGYQIAMSLSVSGFRQQGAPP